MFAGVCLDGIDRVKREQSCDVVIFDRYVLSRFALGRWQKEGRISPAEQVITSMVREDYLPTPDTTAFLRIDPRIALSRILAERGNQPLENKESFSSLEEVAEIYDDIITCPKINSVLPVTVIDATDPPDIIAKSILSDLR